jgi:hypothetical protein
MNGSHPYGKWGIKHAWVDSRRGTGDPRHDYAMLSLKASGGNYVGKNTGSYTLSANGFYANEKSISSDYPENKKQPIECYDRVNLVRFGSYKYWHCGGLYSTGVSGTAFVHYESSFGKWTIGAVLGGYHDGGTGNADFASRWDGSIYSFWNYANRHSLS